MTGAALSSVGAIWMAGMLAPMETGIDPLLVAIFPWAVGAVGVFVSMACALWLDRGIVGHLRAVNDALASGDAQAVRRLPPAWGELDELSPWIQTLSMRLELAARDAAELRAARQKLQGSLDELMTAVERWALVDPTDVAPDAPAPIGRLLELREDREARDREALRDAALEIREALAADLAAARDAVEHAERGFVEATALLGTVRELQRLAGELAAAEPAPQPLPAAAAPAPAPAPADARDAHRDATIAAIEELVSSTATIVERLASGMRRVREIGDQVQVLANRATLIALDAASAPGQETRGAVLQSLAADIQRANEATAGMARDVDRDVADAVEVMSGVRARAVVRLAEALEPAAPSPEPAVEPREPAPLVENRLLERVREVIEDASERGARLAAAGERASSAVERLVRRLEAERDATHALAERLGAPGVPDPGAPGRGDATERGEERP